MPARSNRKGKKQKEDIWQVPENVQTSGSQDDNPNNTWGHPDGTQDNTWELPADTQDNTWTGDNSGVQWDAAASNDWGLPSEKKEEETFKWGVELDPSSVPKQDEGSWDLPAQESAGAIASDAWGGSMASVTDGSVAFKGKARRSGGVKKEQPYIPETPAPPIKMPEDLLEERMLQMEIKNDKIRERREHVMADEEAFNNLTAAERARKEADRKIQAQVNQSRELNAKRKLEKIANREWDRGKQEPDWEPRRDDKERKQSKGNAVSQKRRGDKVTKVERSKDTETPEGGDGPPLNDTSFGSQDKVAEPDTATHDDIIDGNGSQL